MAETVQNFGTVLASLENEQEEVLLVRNNHPVARLVTEHEPLDATAVFGYLHDTLNDETGDELLRTVESSRNKWNVERTVMS